MSKSLEDRVSELEQRNGRVDLDKAWETSLMRKVIISVLTYLVLAGYMHFVIKINPWVNALVPTLGFLLSTLTVKYLKSWWINQQRKDG